MKIGTYKSPNPRNRNSISLIKSKFLSVSLMNTLLAILKVADARRDVILAGGLYHRFHWRHLPSRRLWSFTSFWGMRKKFLFEGEGEKNGLFLRGGTVSALLISWWAGGSVKTNKSTDIRQSKVQSRITWHGASRHGSKRWERLTQAEHVHTSALFKKILSRETDFHQVKIHFKQIRNPILFYSLPVFCCFSQRTAQLTANFDRQDKRISRCRFTKRKFNLISDRDAISDIANGQQIYRTTWFV